MLFFETQCIQFIADLPVHNLTVC